MRCRTIFLYITMVFVIRSHAARPWLILFCILIAISPVMALTLNAGESQTSTPTIAQGDSVFIDGVATGHPQPGLQVWLIGNNYARVTTISVQSDNSFEYELKPEDTQNIAAGQYFVLIQHPMMNGQFDISYNAGTGQVINQQLNGGTVMFILTGPGSLQGSDSAAALISAVNSQNIDDTFTTVTLFVDVPSALIDPIGERFVGEKFTISGTTNLAADDDLLVEVYSSSFVPTEKGQSGEFSGTTGMVKVKPGDGRNNHWSFDVDASTFKPDEYTVRVSAAKLSVTGSTTFTVVPWQIQTPTPTTIVMAATTLPATVATDTPATSPTTQVTPLPIWLTIFGVACAYAAIRHRTQEKL
jgi:hypothetical protein